MTKWTKLDTAWRGVSVDTLLDGMETSADYVVQYSDGGYTTNLPLEDLLDGKAWVAFEYEAEPLEPAHGGPARMLVPRIAEASRELEVKEMGIAGGRQDHYAAAFGGALGLHFRKWVGVEPIPLSAKMLEEIPRRCIVVYTGESRISGKTITAVMEGYRSESSPVRAALAREGV